MSLRDREAIPLSAAKLTFPIENDEESLHLGSFINVLALGCINNEQFQKNKYFLIPFSHYEAFFVLCAKMIKCFASKQQNSSKILEKPFMLNNAVHMFYLNYNFETSLLSFIRYETELKEKIHFNVVFTIENFCQFLKAFKLSILPSLNLSFEQNLFFNYIIKKNIKLDSIKDNPISIMKVVTSFLENYTFKITRNLYLIEIFDFYVDKLDFIQKLDDLLHALNSNELSQ